MSNYELLAPLYRWYAEDFPGIPFPSTVGKQQEANT